MRIVHALGWYWPESVGGTEVYVQGLCHELQKRGVEVVIMAPRDGIEEDEYAHEGIRVVRYPVPQERNPQQLEGTQPHAMFELFEQRLADLGGDVFHLHSLTIGCGVHHLRAARRLGLRTLVTAHVPGIVCARGTMLRFGDEVCDGRVDSAQCVPCWLEDRGVPRSAAVPAARLLQHLPRALGRVPRGQLRTVLRAPLRIAALQGALLEIAESSDSVIAVCEWLHRALLANGVAPAKLRLCRQGVRSVLPVGDRGPLPRLETDRGVRVGYFGRAESTKGLDVLVQAVRRTPAVCAIELRVHAQANGAGDRAYLAGVRDLAGGDPRIQFLAPVPHAEISVAMRHCDLVAVPSRWLETGPLVAMEALAAGIPVLGSDRGGIAELVEEGRTGWLLPAEDVGAWALKLESLARTGARLAWEPAVTPVITTEQVAERMLALYSEVRA
jgi:glycosyltransferase involved in cell wall biosynthesis